MTQAFNFQDGNGEVPAHKHVNGGGWVADTATVSDAAYIGGDARVKRGVYTLTLTSICRSDGYTFTLQSDKSVVAGCRDKNKQEALEYWGSPAHHKHAESIAIVNALYAIAKAKEESQ